MNLKELPLDVTTEIASRDCARTLRSVGVPFHVHWAAACIIQRHWRRRPYGPGSWVCVIDHDQCVHTGRVVTLRRNMACVLVPAVFRHLIYTTRSNLLPAQRKCETDS